ncbi:ABC transporter permease [Natronomonas marina]|jgi:putative ABC transport system permease protein|uniref:ABC transporter permease n=1 Tax=Natronomonas marina TaxID=2961939 RepID=UPI0020C9F37F|nr:ABC transporter permease [Natronomonas marina]
MIGSRLRAAFGIAAAQLRHYRVRTALAVVGVALAVVTIVVLTGVGVSALSVGEAGVTRIDADLWATAGPSSFAPGAVGSVNNQLLDAHEVTREIEDHEDVAGARAVAFQTVYVGEESGEYETIVGAGTTGNGSRFEIEEGRTFSGGDAHYANGSYDGPMSGEVLIDKRAAEQLDIEVGDEIHVGGTLVAADENSFTVVGLTNDVARFIGAPTVVMHLSELQEVSGSTGVDPASTIIIQLEDGADDERVREELAASYPDLSIRTNSEQFEAILRSQSAIIASAVTLAALAVASGIAIVTNVFGLLVYHQRRQLAALKASGVSVSTLLVVTLVEGLVVGGIGAGIGLLLAAPSIEGINLAVGYLGFEDIIDAPRWVFGLGVGLAFVVGVIGAVVAGWRTVRVSPIEHLPR